MGPGSGDEGIFFWSSSQSIWNWCTELVATWQPTTSLMLFSGTYVHAD
jgi:hypothetical protein